MESTQPLSTEAARHATPAPDPVAHTRAEGAGFSGVRALATRTMFVDAVEALLDSGETVLLVDIGIAHHAELLAARGDAVVNIALNEVSRRLTDAVGATGVVSWMGGEQFALAFCCDASTSGVEDPHARATACAEVALRCFDAPIREVTPPLHLAVSAGAVSSIGGERARRLLHGAELALARARAEGAELTVLSAEELSAAIDDFDLMQLLHGALSRGEFHLEYQPIVEIGSGETVEYEALLRWAPAGRDKVEAERFIPFAEELGLIVEIGEWVISRVVEDWATVGGDRPRITVNVSAVQLNSSLERLARALGEAALALDGRLSIEITESRLARDLDGARAILESLKERGVGIVLDDFGTGFSSLLVLSALPVDALKIDRRFVAKVHESFRDWSIAGSIIDLAHTLGIKVVAEGIESAAQLRGLVELDCDFAQGFYFSHPERIEEFLERS